MQREVPWNSAGNGGPLSPEVAVAFVEALLDGNKQAEEQFHARYVRLVEMFARGWTNALQTRDYSYSVEDLVPYTFMYVIYGQRFTGKQDFSPNTPPLQDWLKTPWIPLDNCVKRIVRYYMRELVLKIIPRGRGRDTLTDSDDPLDNIPNSETAQTLDDQLLSRRRSLCIRHCWESLSFRDRYVLDLYYYREFTQAEIARQLGVSEATISRLRRGAENRLGTCLKNDCPDVYSS